MSRPSVASRRVATGVLVSAAAAAVLLAAAPASAEQGSIDHFTSKDGRVQVLFSLPGSGNQKADLSSLHVTFAGKTLKAKAQLESDAQAKVRRTTVLAIDVSDSMRGAKFAAAKQAADVYLDSVPADVRVGIVTFAGKVEVLQAPSLDRAASHRLVKGLKLSFGTHLYDGLSKATQTSGSTGLRSVLVLSDGRDTSRTELSTTTAAIKKSKVKVDVIALAQSAHDEKLLAPLSRAGGGTVISASKPAQLRKIFTSEAQALASQILIDAPVPAGTPTEGTLAVDVAVGTSTFTDSAFVMAAPATKAAARVSAATAATDLRPVGPGFQVSTRSMALGFLAILAGLLVLVGAIFGGLSPKEVSLASRIEAYTTRGGSVRKPADQAPSISAQAVGMAQKALDGSRGFEASLGAKLDAGGLSLKPAEWLPLHAGFAFATTIVFFLLTGGNVLLTFVALVGGILLPWLYLGRKQSRRLKAFNGQLAGTLQLLAGSLQAGLSIAQGMDTIVREGAEPVAGEFRRALVETRLGVQIEDALEGVAARMKSDDFKWTVMAIRIQREVGGNLAELMLNVATTLRERDYLRRQVKSLSAEGRFSAYILLSLPPGILLYEITTNPTYVHPLFVPGIGWVMLAGMALLMGLGAFMMSRMIKLEV